MSQEVDKDRYRDSLAWLHEVYKGISETATEVSTWRCPYKNVEDHCTARFKCRNQFFQTKVADERPICTGSDKLDYRAAWDT